MLRFFLKKASAWLKIENGQMCRECSLKDIEEEYIEGEPKATINTVPVAPDLTVDGNGKLDRRHRREGENGGICKIHP